MCLCFYVLNDNVEEIKHDLWLLETTFSVRSFCVRRPSSNHTRNSIQHRHRRYFETPFPWTGDFWLQNEDKMSKTEKRHFIFFYRRLLPNVVCSFSTAIIFTSYFFHFSHLFRSSKLTWHANWSTYLLSHTWWFSALERFVEMNVTNTHCYLASHLRLFSCTHNRTQNAVFMLRPLVLVFTLTHIDANGTRNNKNEAKKNKIEWKEKKICKKMKCPMHDAVVLMTIFMATMMKTSSISSLSRQSVFIFCRQNENDNIFCHFIFDWLQPSIASQSSNLVHFVHFDT